MPILLDTPFNPGDHDAGETYPRAKIANIDINVARKTVAITVDFGNLDNDVWAVGPGSMKKRIVLSDSGGATDFTDLMTELTQDGEDVYSAVKRVAYAKLQAAEASLAGAIE